MMNTSRQGLLATAGDSTVAASVPSRASARPEPMVLAWSAAAGDVGAHAIGRRCLELNLVEAELHELAHFLCAAVEDLKGHGCSRSPADLRQALQDVLRSEFRAGDVVRVHGWILSRSEARFYALSYLVAHEPSAQAPGTAP